MAINKSDFIAAVAKQANVAIEAVDAVIEAIGTVVAHQLVVDGAVRVPGLVNVTAKHCAARPGRNLRTMEPCIIPEAVRLRTSPSAPLETKFRAAQEARPT